MKYNLDICSKKGFAVLEILIVIAILAILLTGAFIYNSRGNNGKSVIETNLEAVRQAKDAAKTMQSRGAEQQNAIDGLTGQNR